MIDFRLRDLRPEDSESIALHGNDKDIADNLTNRFPFPYTLDNAKSFIAFACNSDLNHFIQAITIDDIAIGAIGLHPQTDVSCKNAELGYWIGKKHWGQKIMSRAITQMLDYGFKNLDITRIYARPYPNNIASQKILEKNGFILEARLKDTLFKNDQYLDELIYAIRK